MAPSARDRISVDLHGLKAALVARAQAERVDVSVVVRRAVGRELGVAEGRDSTVLAAAAAASSPVAPMVKLSIRLTRPEAAKLADGAKRAGLSRGAFIAGLLAGTPAPVDGATRLESIAALNASCAELSTLSRNLHHLAVLLRHGQVRAAKEYRAMLDTLVLDVRKHLGLASGVLAALRPARTSRHEGERHVP